MDNLSVLKESLARSDNMTTNMLSILSSFENRLSKLEETIIPIYQETGNLQRRHESILAQLHTFDCNQQIVWRVGIYLSVYYVAVIVWTSLFTSIKTD